MSERIRGSYDDALYKSTFTLLTLLYHVFHVFVVVHDFGYYLLLNSAD